MLLTPFCSSIHQTPTHFICTQVFPHTPDTGEQAPTQHTDMRHQQKNSGQLPFSVLTALCCLMPVGTQRPPQAVKPWCRVSGKRLPPWGFLHQGQNEAFQKQGAVLKPVMDLQACWGFSAVSSCPHVKESFRPAAIRGPVMR